MGWLDRAIETLGRAGLKVVLGTPTATPPRWMVDKHPDMLPVDAQGKPANSARAGTTTLATCATARNAAASQP